MTSLRLIACRGLMILSALSAPSAADQVIRGYVAEGPDFELPADMSIARQEIDISLRSVRLTYVFKSARHHTVPFRFVLPDMPVDASPDAIGLPAGGGTAEGLAVGQKPINYLNLVVRVNGAPLTLTGRGRARSDGVDVTQLLLDAGVPLLYDLDGKAPWRRLPEKTQAMLETHGLLSLDAAQWSYQAIYAWDQRFEPGETRIELSYAPQARYWSDIDRAHFPPIEPGGWAARTYCIDDALRRAFYRHPADEELYTVTHRLAPSRTGRGPVARYHLAVDKQAPTNRVAFCPPEARKTSPTTFEWHAEDFTPDENIDVLFFAGPDTWSR